MSNDTIRRYIALGRLTAHSDASNRTVLDGAERAEFSREHFAEVHDPTPGMRSARNNLVGLVTDVVVDDVTAKIEMAAGRQRLVSLMSAEAARDLDLRPGSMTVARVKATDVIVERPTA